MKVTLHSLNVESHTVAVISDKRHATDSILGGPKNVAASTDGRFGEDALWHQTEKRTSAQGGGFN